MLTSSFPILKFEIILGKWPGDEANIHLIFGLGVEL